MRGKQLVQRQLLMTGDLVDVDVGEAVDKYTEQLSHKSSVEVGERGKFKTKLNQDDNIDFK